MTMNRIWAAGSSLSRSAHVMRWAAVGVGAFATVGAAQQVPPKIPVVVALPQQKRITNWDEYSGRFEAVASVEVKARVAGFIDKIHFQDGQIVKAGDLLFTLDKRSYEIAVESSQADVAKADAQVEQTGADVERAQPLVESRTISGQAFDLRRANAAVALAAKQAAEATRKSAELNLEWTEVRAPIAGRVSDKKVDIGTLISGGASAPSPTVLTTIVSIDPIHFVFDVSESDYLRYTRLHASGGRPSSRDVSNPVRIRLSDEPDFTHEGKMNFVDNQLSVKSGTLRGRAVLPNAEGLLTPGVFGRLQLFGGEADAILISDSAIISDQARKVVFTVDKEDTVVATPVTLGPMVDGLRVIKTGLKPDMRVIVEGIANPAVRPGGKVDPQTKAAPAKAASN